MIPDGPAVAIPELPILLIDNPSPPSLKPSIDVGTAKGLRNVWSTAAVARPRQFIDISDILAFVIRKREDQVPARCQ